MAEYSVRAVEGGWTWKHGGRSFPTLYEDLVERCAATVPVPVAYVSGGLSGVVDDALAERAALVLPDATMLRLPGAHHHLPLEVPHTCARLIDELGSRQLGSRR